MAIFGKKEDSYLGVDFGAGGIKIVELKKTKDRPQLWTYGLATMNLDIHITMNEPEKIDESKEVAKTKSVAVIDASDKRVDEYSKLLKDLCAEARVSTKRATASLPVSYVFHAVINLPKVNPKDLEHHVIAKVKKMTPWPIDEMQIVHQLIPPTAEEEKKDFMKVLVTAVPKSLVLFFTSIFQKAGLHLDALETEAFALERSLVGKDKATSMIVDIGAERTNFFIVDQGLPLTHRSIRFGGNMIDEILAQNLGVGIDDVKQIKKDISKAPPGKINDKIFESSIDQLVKEIQYGFDLFLHQVGNERKRPEKIILTGGSAIFPPILNYIKRFFDVRVFVGDPWSRVVYQGSIKPILMDIGPRMSVAIGLAMREIVNGKQSE